MGLPSVGSIVWEIEEHLGWVERRAAMVPRVERGGVDL